MFLVSGGPFPFFLEFVGTMSPSSTFATVSRITADSLSDMSDNWLPHYSCCFSVDQVSNTLQCGSTEDFWPPCGAGSGQAGPQEPRVGASASAQPRAAPEAPAASKDLVGYEALCFPDTLVPYPYSLAMYRPMGMEFMRDSPDSVS